VLVQVPARLGSECSRNLQPRLLTWSSTVAACRSVKAVTQETGSGRSTSCSSGSVAATRAGREGSVAATRADREVWVLGTGWEGGAGKGGAQQLPPQLVPAL
jgi:hypothetical protein